jgi:hypothetical protein
MRLRPLPRPLLDAGKVGWRQVRFDFVSEFRSLFRVPAAAVNASSRQIVPEIGF